MRDDRTGSADAPRRVAAMLRAEIVRALAPAGGSVAPGYPGRLLVGPRTLPHARPGDVVWGGGLGDALERRLVAVDGVDHRGAAGPMADRAIREAGGDASLGVVGDPLLLLGDLFPERVGDRGAAAGIGVVADVDDAEIEAVEGARRIVLEEDPWRSAEALAGCASIVTSSADVLAIADGLGVPVRLVRDAGTLRAHLDDHAFATGRGRTALAASVAEAMQDEPLAPAAFDAEALRAAFPAELWRTPRVSVVVPTANVATWVDECLDSLMTQELDDLEVIVVDDRSSDDTVALARAAARRDRRIRVVAGAVAGGGSARNLGVDLARGEYLAFADGDDLVPEGAYRALTEAGDRSGSDLVLGRFLKFSASKTWDPTRSWSVFKEDREAVDLVGEPSIIRGRACWNKLYRASWFRDEGIRFPDVPRSNDIVPVVTAYVRARTIDIVRDRVYLYRDRPGGTSMTAKAGQLRGLRSYLTQECLCLDLVRGTGDARLLDEYTRMIVQSDGWVLVTRVLEALTESSPEDEAAIADRMRALLGGLSPDALATLPMERAIVFSLIASGDLRGAKAAHAEHNLLDAARAIGGLERLVAASDALDAADADPALHSVLALASARVALAEVQSRARDAASAAAAVASIASRAPENGPRRDPRMGVVVEASLAGRHGVLERLSAVGGGGVVARTARRLGGGVQVEGEAPVALAGARLTVLAEPDAGGPVHALGQIEISDVEGEGSWSFAIGPGALADGVWRLQIAAGDDAAGPEAAFLSRLRWSAQPFSETSSRADRVAVHGRVGERYEVKLHAFPAAPRRAARAVARRLDPRLQRVVARAITGARSAAGRIQPSSASEANRAGD
ncbi:glycosyltransferase family 2 protein [Agrococcus carbonis]|uniref:glycosyltransferase family 2 protein n=1 Tax=Agrococcus carbonis TaxID=684552 RepID=UPI0012F72E94|nr:glycosyltransferase family 2 protein [Agrococcus carbonis]